MADQKLYDEGLRPKILINWDTFEDWGISSNWKGPFTDAVINAYTRWMNLAGVDLRFQFWGYTTKTSSDSGELVIKMNEKFGERLASTFGSYNRLEIVFHRKRNSDLTPWNFVPYNANPGEFDMQAILMHELGHCLGLDHTASGSPTVMTSYSYFARFGPFSSDVNDERAVYSDFTQNRLRQQRSANSGASWSEVNNNLTTHGHVEARTNLNPGVIATPKSGFYVVGWSRVGSRAPTWLRGDGNIFLKRHWLFYGGERSIYGPTFARDDDNTLLWAWVDNDDLGTIKIARSTNQTYQWGFVGRPANAITYGTPGLCWTRVNGQSTWILVWAYYDRSDRNNTGYIRASISTNNGSTWSTPVVLDTFYKTLSGVSATASANNQIVVAFAWAPHST
ncbi:MAG: matrixin family metalloprotease, partial [Nitrospirota bacterium]